MVRRLLAAAFAVVVLFVAFGIREERRAGRGFVGGGGAAGRADGTAGDDGYSVFETDEVSLLCIEDLRSLCEDDLDLFGFEVRMEPAWTTVERLRDGGELGADVWLTVNPFPELARSVADGGGRRAPALGTPTAVLARSPIVVAGSSGAMEALATRCPDVPTLFACAAGAAPPGQVVLRDAASSALGSLALTAVANEVGADAATLATQPEVAERLAALARGARRSQAPFEDALRIGGSSIAITPEAELLRVAGEVDDDRLDAELERLALRYPLDVRAVEVVAVPTPTFGRPKDLERALLSRAAGYAFDRDGWVAEGRPNYLLEEPAFTDRPAVRTDLPWDPQLVREVRRIVVAG